MPHKQEKSSRVLPVETWGILCQPERTLCRPFAKIRRQSLLPDHLQSDQTQLEESMAVHDLLETRLPDRPAFRDHLALRDIDGNRIFRRLL